MKRNIASTFFPMAALLLAMALSACGGGGDQTSTTSGSGARSTGGTTSAPPGTNALYVYASGTGTGRITSSNVSGVNCTSSCTQYYSTSQSVTLSATADAGSVFAGWSGDCSLNSCTVSMNSSHSVTAIFTSNTSAPPTPTGIYTDLSSAPVGAYVTVYGIDSTSSSWPIFAHGNGKTIVQVPSSAPALTVGGTSVPVGVHTGRVIVRTTSTLTSSDISNIQPGDVIYLHAGTYTGHYGATYWNDSSFVMFSGGTASQPVAIVAYPGESVTIDNSGSGGNDRPNFYLGNTGGGQKGSYLTIAGLNLIAQVATIDGGGDTSSSNTTPETGAAYVRVVGCTHTILDTTQNTMTGIISIQGDGWKVFGNTLQDAANRQVWNNNHGIYVQNGADDVEIAYNTLSNLHMGHTIQVHQDGTPYVYSNIWIHDNLIQGVDANNARGMTVSNVDNTSTVRIENNTLRNVGQNFSALSVYRGSVIAYNNTFDTILGPAMDLSGNYDGTRTVYETGNTFSNVSGGNFTAGSGATLSQYVHCTAPGANGCPN